MTSPIIELSNCLGDGVAVDVGGYQCVIVRVLAVRGRQCYLTLRTGDQWDMDDTDLTTVSVEGEGSE